MIGIVSLKMSTHAYQHLIDAINESAEPVPGQPNHYQSLLDKIGNARFVLIGEATHGTHEFYQTRIDITRELIQKKDFMAVAIEGDWPDAHRIDSYLQGANSQDDWQHALDDFKRFPTWMWRNTTMPPFIHWLRSYNDKIAKSSEKIGFYGLDLYSLRSSMQAVIDYLLKVDPDAAARARERYACFDHMQPNPNSYGYLANMGIKKSCVEEAVTQLLELQHRAFDHTLNNSPTKHDELFYATQNARLVKNAEKYYRSMFEGAVNSWNVRDQHMVETLNILADHLENRFKKPAKIVIWAHNSHVGDARATEMGEQGEVNIGSLMREQHDMDTYLIGFSTYQGTVTAASDWDEPAECKQVSPGFEGSYEELFHHIKYKKFLLDLHANAKLEHYLHLPRLQRAIGVVYRPETERTSHYFFTRLPYQFDSIIHFDKTKAVQPLETHDAS